MGENYERWSERNRIMQDQWDRATAGLHSGRSSPGFNVTPGPGAPSYGGGGGHAGGGSGLLGLFAWVVGIPILVASVIVWPVLYCVPVAITFVVSAVVNGMLAGAFDPSSPSGETWTNVCTAIIALVLLVALSRVDHKAARSRLWWIPRHLIRLAVIAILAHLIAASAMFPMEQLERQAVPGLELLRRPPYVAVLVAVVVAAHVVLTRRRLRDWWRTQLEGVKLRPRFGVRVEFHRSVAHG